jgi:hypothetical protein
MYWSFGNTGKNLKTDKGQILEDIHGRRVEDKGKPFWGGMVFRGDLDGKNLEILGHNFRNNYEVTVDSFGSLWQSDNDDDGNRATRINFIMEGGNFGYLDEMTGEGWRKKRPGMHKDVSLAHWHLNDPGVVPNVLQTGAGAPTGITVYEGRLLPQKYWDQLIHCESGVNVVRAYPVRDHGAGYQADSIEIMKSLITGTMVPDRIRSHNIDTGFTMNELIPVFLRKKPSLINCNTCRRSGPCLQNIRDHPRII